MRPEILLCAMAIAFAGDANASSASHVVKLRGTQVTTFEMVDGRFKRAGNVPAGIITLPAPVVQHSPKGYLQVRTSSGVVWLDKLDVVIDPPLAVKARCVGQVSVQADSTSAMTHGAGEGC